MLNQFNTSPLALRQVRPKKLLVVFTHRGCGCVNVARGPDKVVCFTHIRLVSLLEVANCCSLSPATTLVQLMEPSCSLHMSQCQDLPRQSSPFIIISKQAPLLTKPFDSVTVLVLHRSLWHGDVLGNCDQLLLPLNLNIVVPKGFRQSRQA